MKNVHPVDPVSVHNVRAERGICTASTYLSQAAPVPPKDFSAFLRPIHRIGSDILADLLQISLIIDNPFIIIALP